MCWEGSKMATQAPPSPKWQVGGSKVGGLFIPHVGTRQGPAKDPPPITWPGEREGGKTRHFSKYSLIKRLFQETYFTKYKWKACHFLTAMSKSAYLLSTSCEKRKCALYSNPSLKWQPFSVGYTTFYRQQLCRRQWTSRTKPATTAHVENSKLFVIFPAESTAAHSLHIQHLDVNWGYRFKTPIANEAFR